MFLISIWLKSFGVTELAIFTMSIVKIDRKFLIIENIATLTTTTG